VPGSGQQSVLTPSAATFNSTAQGSKVKPKEGRQYTATPLGSINLQHMLWYLSTLHARLATGVNGRRASSYSMPAAAQPVADSAQHMSAWQQQLSTCQHGSMAATAQHMPAWQQQPNNGSNRSAHASMAAAAQQ
jgi:hypothetical protein